MTTNFTALAFSLVPPLPPEPSVQGPLEKCGNRVSGETGLGAGDVGLSYQTPALAPQTKEGLFFCSSTGKEKF
jgi:hypothetical protein